MNDEGRTFLEARAPAPGRRLPGARYASKDHYRAEDLVQETYIRAPYPRSQANGDLAPRHGSSPSASTWLAANGRKTDAGPRSALPALHDPEAPGVDVPDEALASIDRGFG